MADNKDKRTIEIIVNGQQANASLKEMNAAAAVLYNQFNKLSADDPGRAKLIADYRAVKDRVGEVKTELTGVAQAAGGMRQMLQNAFAFAIGGGIESVIGKVMEIGKSIFQTTAKFETYSAVMTNALGSSSAAQKALADIQQMAATTPFSVDELTGSFIKFVNRGLNPSMEEMGNLADLAASQGKSFDQLTEAVLDAGTGEFERLKEFGIQASKAGDQVSLTFKGVQHTVANTPEAINALVVSLGDVKGIAGSTAAISATLEGQLSNVGDTADAVAVQVGQGLRPVFVALLSSIGFFLGVLKELPSFLKENRGLLLGLGVALMTLNGQQIAATATSLALNAAEKARAIATRASAAAQWLLNAAMTANPIGLVVAAVALLVGGFVTLYEKSETVRATIAGLGAVFKQVFANIAQAAVEHLAGLGDVIVGVATFDIGKIQSGGQKLINSFKMLGAGAGDAFHKGYDGKLAEEKAERDAKAVAEAADGGKEKGAADGKARAAAEAKARMEALKNEEADLKVRLAQVKEGTELEMRLKQQLVANEARQQLEDEKKTAADRRVIRAEALQKQTKLAQEFYEKQAKDRKDARKQEEEDERKHQLVMLNEEEAALVATGNKRAIEFGKVMLDAQRKVLAVTGTEKEKNAAIQLLMEEAWQKQRELQATYATQDAKDLEDKLNDKIRLIDAGEAEKEAALELRREQGKIAERAYQDELYEIKRDALQKELDLLIAAGKGETEDAKKIQTALLNNQAGYHKAIKALDLTALKTKQELQKLEVKTASEVVGTTIDLLFKDEDARRKHHDLYIALSAAKIMMDGYQEVASIWRYSADNPYNGPTAGVAGAVMGGIQTAMAVARTFYTLSQLNEVPGYAAGGRTGDGVLVSPNTGQAVSPWGALMEYSGMRVGSNGKLTDTSGFAVAGVVHEDEYVIPKWLRQDPQVAAFENWVEAKRMRGFYEGGRTSPTGMASPVPLASFGSDGAGTTEVLTAMLTELRSMSSGLAEVRNWQSKFQVVLDVQGHQKALAEQKQVAYDSALRLSKN